MSLPTKKQKTVLTRNEPEIEDASGGNPARPSNASLMKSLGEPDRFSAGMPAFKTAEDLELRLMASYYEKIAGEEREPEVDDHASAPSDKMRPRAEVICYTKEGVYGIDKGDYLLFPGGGIDDGEQPRDGAIRETIEEANRHPINVTPSGVVESIWPKDSGNEFWDDSDFDGERTYFFLGFDSGEAGVKHDDQEDFKVMGFDSLKSRLRELIDDEEQEWAKRNNEERLRLVEEAEKLAKADPKPLKQAQAVPPPPPGLDITQQSTVATQLPGIQKDPNAMFVDQLAAKFKQQTQQQAQQAPAPQPAPMERVTQKIAESLIAYRDISDPDDREQLEQDVQADVHGAPQAEDVIQFAQKDVLEKTAVIKEEDGKYKLYTSDGKKVLGTHDSREKALAQERAIQYSKAKGAAAENEGLEELEGGFADNVSGEKYDARELVEGAKVEMEHTDEGDKAVEIAKDHLEEISDYYTRLEEMEEEAEEHGHEKVADVVQLIPRQDHILFLPDGRIVVRRAENRRFRFPGEGPGKRAPYETPVTFLPESGVPQEGFHGFTIAPRVGEVPELPEGYEAMSSDEVLRNLYASMGLAVNRPYRQLDRTRARVINRWIKRRKKEKERERLSAAVAEYPGA